MSGKVAEGSSRNWLHVAVLGALTIAIVATVAVGGNYLLRNQFGPSQASAADCALAQRIIDDSQHVPAGKAQAEKWRKDTRAVRISQMKDGYLGLQISRYEGWAVAKVTGADDPPTKDDFQDMVDEANSHCEKKLKIPEITWQPSPSAAPTAPTAPTRS